MHVIEVVAAESDIDELGHVSNLVYVRWVQAAAVAHSTAAGWPMSRYQELGAAFVVRRHEIDYKLPVQAGERLRVETWVEWWKQVTSERHTVLRRASDAREVARAVTLWAFVDLATGKPRRIPDEVSAPFGAST